jgi:23S rRNA (guanosine2251-2'-O)-methyltransferase
MAFEFVYGVQPVLQVLTEKRRKSQKILLHRTHLSPELKKVLHIARKEGIPIEEVDKHQLSQSTQTTQHQGIAIKTEEYSYDTFDLLMHRLKQKTSGLVLVLDQIQDPQNLGAILRTALCAGVDGVLLPEKGSALVSPSVMKASAGGAESVPVVLVPNLVNALLALKKAGYWIFGAEGASSTSLWKADLQRNLALVLGNEGLGIRNSVKKQCDFLISIPVLGTISALNVSVSTSIPLFIQDRKNLKMPRQCVKAKI